MMLLQNHALICNSSPFMLLKMELQKAQDLLESLVSFNNLKEIKPKKKRKTFSESFLTSRLVLLYGNTLFGHLIWSNSRKILDGYLSWLVF